MRDVGQRSAGPAKRPAAARATRGAAPRSPAAATALTLQRAIGNHATTSLLQRGKKKKKVVRHSVPAEAKEVARDIVAQPHRYGVFGNAEGALPNAASLGTYHEADVGAAPDGTRGQNRVVVFIPHKGGQLRKYFSNTHYGTGDDAARTRADFFEFS